MKYSDIYRFAALAVGLPLTIFASPLLSQIPSPTIFFEQAIGDDRSIVNWPRLVAYYRMLSEKSDRVSVLELGATDGGEPLLLVTISSEHNIKNLARIKNLQLQAANPTQLTDEDARLLARQNVAVVAIILNATSDGIISSQVGAKLAHNLAVTQDPQKTSMLEQVLIQMVPCMNPAGLQSISDWYRRYKNTDHEASKLTGLSHPIAGDEYLYDWVALNLSETRMVARQMYETWFPEVIYEQREVSGQGARMQVLVYPSDRHAVGRGPKALLADFHSAIQQHTELPGIEVRPTDWLPFDGTVPGAAALHNQISFLSLAAQINVASPLFFPPSSIPHTESRSLLATGSWRGGWWRQSDIIKYELASIQTMLQTVAENRESIIYHFCRANLDEIARGRKGSPYAYVIPAGQHDQNEVVELLQLMMSMGVQVHASSADFTADGVAFHSGDYVVLLAQGGGRLARQFLDKPENRVSRAGAFSRTPLLSGINAVRVDAPFSAPLRKQSRIVSPPKKLRLAVNGDYLVQPASNAVAFVINRLLLLGKKVYRLRESLESHDESFSAGTVYLPANEMPAGRMDELAREYSVDIRQVKGDFSGTKVFRLRKPRVAVLQSWRPTADEGWTRLVLNNFEFDYESIYGTKVRNSDLRGDFDVLILPALPPADIVNGWQRAQPKMYEPQVPRSYLGGISESGVQNLETFVRKGGTLIAFGEACRLPMKQFGLPVQEVVAPQTNDGNDGTQLVQLKVDSGEPLAYGMPSTTFGIVVNGPVLRPMAWGRRTRVAAVFSQADSLNAASRAAFDFAAGMSAALTIPMGEGRVVLFGIRPQYRAQTPATFKLLFNAIFLGRSEEVIL